eukprot:2574648-Pleurochrysis_carterae.AAC.2
MRGKLCSLPSRWRRLRVPVSDYNYPWRAVDFSDPTSTTASTPRSPPPSQPPSPPPPSVPPPPNAPPPPSQPSGTGGRRLETEVCGQRPNVSCTARHPRAHGLHNVPLLCVASGPTFC